MTSICNYSHPEHQISDGLTRHGKGALFPFNPEFYDRASGLYGPGSIYAWHFMLASVIVNWSFYGIDDYGHTRPRISMDLLAVVLYPVFAATDFLILTMRFLGAEYRALVIFCLRFPETELDLFARFDDKPLNLRHIPPNILSLGQRVIEITGPLTVCYTFSAVAFTLFNSIETPFSDMVPWRPASTTKRLVYYGYAYVLLVLTVFHLSIGNLGISFFIFLYEAILPWITFVMICSSIFIAMALVGSLAMFISSVVKRNAKDAFDAAKMLAASLFIGACCPVTMMVFAYCLNLRVIPDLAVTITERDQLATLMVGVMTLGFTLFTVARQQTLPERDLEALRNLTSEGND